jgi:hypothetical protein
MQVWDYEKASIQERENAKAVQCAVDQLVADIPDVEVTEVKLHSRTAPLSDENLRIKGPRWFVTANIRNLKDNSKAQVLYRVWRSQEEWKAAQVRIAQETT